MPIFATFVMGPKETYFFNTPSHWAWHNLPPDIEALFTKSPAIQDVIELAISDNGTYFVSYRDHDGQVTCKHYNLPNHLVEFLYQSQPTVVRDLTTLSITLGPYESYYAWDKNSAVWGNLPPSLEKAVLARLESQDSVRTTWKAGGAEAPSFVTLGADGAYFMRTVCGGGCWDLKGGKKGDGREGTEGIRGTNEFLEKCPDFSGVASVHLFPSHPNAYITILTSGKVFSNLPEFTWVDYNKIAPAMPSFVQSVQPIPPVPQPKSQQPQAQPVPQAAPQMQPGTGYMQPQQPQVMSYQQPIQQQQQQQYVQPMVAQHNCCPQTAPGAPHNCCPQTPMQSRPYGNFLPVFGQQPVVQHASPQQPYVANNPNMGYAGNGGYMYR